MICKANQWTGFYMIGISVMKEAMNGNEFTLKFAALVATRYFGRHC